MRRPWSVALLVGLGTLAGAAPASAVTITEFPLEAGQIPRYIHVGPDQNLWFTEVGTAPGIGRISPAGERFALIPDALKPVDLVTMADGTVVWTDDEHALGRRLPNGFTQAKGGLLGPAYAVALTSTGDLRWTEQAEGFGGEVCQLLGGWEAGGTGCAGWPPPTTRVTGLTLGAEGRLWAAGYEANNVRRMNAVSENFDLEVSLPAGSGPARLALGPDGNLWVTMYDASAIDRIAPNGSRTRFQLPPGAGPNDIVAGPDGALWFTELKAGAIGRITTDGVLTNEFAIPTAGSQPVGITTGPDGALWFTESGTGKIGRLQLASASGGGGGEGTGSGGTGLADHFPPVFVHGAAFSPKRFRVAAGATPVSARRSPTPRGSSLSYSLSEPAAVTIVIARSGAGRKVGKTCRAQSRSNRHSRPCTRYVTVGTLKRRALQGANRVAFTGRIGRRALNAASYRATVTATDAAGNVSVASTASFAIAAS